MTIYFYVFYCFVENGIDELINFSSPVGLIWVIFESKIVICMKLKIEIRETERLKYLADKIIHGKPRLLLR